MHVTEKCIFDVFVGKNISVLRHSSRGGSSFAPEAAKEAKPLFFKTGKEGAVQLSV